MKSFYTVLLMVMLVTGSAFATAAKAHRSFDPGQLGELKSWSEVSKNFRKAEKSGVKSLRTLETQTSLPAAKTAPAKVASMPKTIDELVAGTYTATYQGMLNSNVGLHEGEASFEYYSEYNELYLILPDCDLSFYISNYEKGKLTFPGGINFGQNGSYLMFMVTITAAGQLYNEDIEATFNEQTGEFDFPSDYGLAFAAVDPSTYNIAGYYWAGCEITLKAYGEDEKPMDYALSVALDDECTPDNKFTFEVTTGADVADVKALIYPGDIAADDIRSYLGDIYFEVLGESVEVGKKYVIDPVSGNSFDDITESGHASLLLAAYDADGNIVKTTQVSMLVILENEEGWRDVAEVDYNDQLFVQYYNNFSHTQKVMLQEAEDAPGYYRFVNPYSGLAAIHDKTCPHYFMLDARDPEWVTIPFSVSGLDLGGDGILAFGSFAVLGYDKESAATNGLPGGSLKDQVVSFPLQSILCHEQFYNAPGRWAYMNGASPVSFTLPDITLDLTIVDQKNNPVEGAVISIADATNPISALSEEDDLADEHTTDANGNVSVTVPFSTGYFGSVNVNVYKAATEEFEAVNNDFAVDLNGANTAHTQKVEITTGVEKVSVENVASEYYNLQGIRVNKPSKGVYIKKTGDKTVKVQVR